MQLSSTRQAVSFLAMLFASTWLWGYLSRPLLQSGDTWVFLAGILPSVWAPTILALLICFIGGGTVAVKGEVRSRFVYRRGYGRWVLVAAFFPLFAVAGAMAVARYAGAAVPFVSTESILPTIGLQLITGAVGEEAGWRGFLLTRLGARFGSVSAALTMASLWTLWHIPAFFTPGMPHQFIPKAPFLIAIVSFGVFLALVFNECGESVVPTITAHVALNVMLAVGGVDISSAAFWWSLAVINGSIAAVALVRLIRRNEIGTLQSVTG